MRTTQLLIAVALVVALADRVAVADDKREKISVTVVDQAGSIVYLEPGEVAGLRPGQKVWFGKRSYRIVAITGTSATIDVGTRVLRLGAKGSATVTVGEQATKTRPVPKKLDAYDGQWGEPRPPAEEQNPTPVPIGHIRRRGGSEVLLRATSSSLLPIGGGDRVTRIAVRAQLRAEPFAETPFGVDADVELARWIGRGLSRDLGADSRPLIEVHELRLRYGDRDDPTIGLGRLRYASATVGLLDGARVVSPRFGGVSVHAFGGVVPNALDGKPSSEVSRFGAGVNYLNLEHSWRPSAELAASGSIFESALDERRLAGNLRLYPGPVSLGARAELSLFDKDNPWGANALELSAAGIDAGVAHKRWRAGVSIDAMQPERSAWLASLLPASWLCTAEALPAGAGRESCDGDRDTRYFGLATAGVDLDALSLRLGASSVADEDFAVDQTGGFLDVGLPKVWRKLSVDLGTSVSRASFVEIYAVRAGLSSPVSSALDLSVFYRPALLVYDAAVADLVEHRVGAEAFYAPAVSWGLRLAAEAATGDDATVLGVFATAVWRASL